MAHYIKEVSRTFGEYLLIPSLTTKECTPDNVSLKTPVVKFRQGETSKIIEHSVCICSDAGSLRRRSGYCLSP